jgi:hypothetical protein
MSRWLLAVAAVTFARPALASEPVVAIVADPPALHLAGPGAAHSLLIHGRTADGRLIDLTRDAHYRAANPAVARVDGRGVVRGVGDGETSLTVEAAGRSVTAGVSVRETGRPRDFHFETDVEPILGRFGCNASGCHGKAEGQNGFKLSVFAFDPAADYAALVKESRGRRVFAAAPEESLLLRKASGRAAHGGGTRIPVGSEAYAVVRGWVAAGAPYGRGNEPTLEGIRVEPAERALAARGRQQLRVVARFSDGHEADVTARARFQSNNEGLAAVDADGLVTAGDAPGEAAVMASYLGAVGLFRALVPRDGPLPDGPQPPAFNFIDPLVDRKLAKLRIRPSPVCDDAEFLRRVSLDVIGTLPTPAESRRFLADRRPDRRARLVDELLERPEYADYWALKWADLLRVDRAALGHRRAYTYYHWVRESFAANKPLDRFAREWLTAEGPLSEVGPANFYLGVTKPGEQAGTFAQVFLGVRIACAQCHHHPYDRWTQTDYAGMTAFFLPLQVKAVAGTELLLAAGSPTEKHPRTGEPVFAHALGVPAPSADPPGDRRGVLADWLTAPDNPYFARNIANRYWAHFLGRGLVEPVDDVRATNPPNNPELLDALARHLTESKYDVKQLVRAVTASRVYQTSSRPDLTNETDGQNYSRAALKRIDAEVLLDMVCRCTGVGEKFAGVPAGVRAVQLWDSKSPHYFLKLFGRPVRASACECERVTEPSVAQVLHVLNSPEIHAKIAHESGTVARLVRELPDDGGLAEELYLTCFCRPPDDRERAAAVAYLGRDRAKRRQAAEDLLWGLMNTLEFVFNH